MVSLKYGKHKSLPEVQDAVKRFTISRRSQYWDSFQRFLELFPEQNRSLLMAEILKGNLHVRQACDLADLKLEDCYYFHWKCSKELLTPSSDLDEGKSIIILSTVRWFLAGEESNLEK